MDALLLTQVRSREYLELDRRSEGAKKERFADRRQQQDAIGIDEVCRKDDVGLGADVDLADEGGYQDSGSDRLDVPLRLFWR
jgi:hypothetical protein